MVGWVAPICEETAMQVPHIRSTWIPLQKGQALRTVVSVEFLFLAVLAGFAQGSWTILVVVFLVLQCSSMAITVRTTFQVVVSIIWAYIGFKIGSWLGSNLAGIIFAAYVGTVAFWLHFLYAKMSVKTTQIKPSGGEKSVTVCEGSSKTTDRDLASILRETSPIHKAGNIDTLQVLIAASVTLFIIGCMELGRENGQPDNLVASVGSELESMPQFTNRERSSLPTYTRRQLQQGSALWSAAIALRRSGFDY
jgi:hypothetical protein